VERGAAAEVILNCRSDSLTVKNDQWVVAMSMSTRVALVLCLTVRLFVMCGEPSVVLVVRGIGEHCE
jgi:hypothetical protein